MDRSTFAAEYRKAYPSLWTLAVGLCGNRELANDIVQDAVIRSWKKIDQFEMGTNFCSWLSRFVRNVALNQNRKQGRQKTTATDPLELDAQVNSADWHGDLTDKAWTAENSNALETFDESVKSALDRIPNIQRSCLLLRIVNELNIEEISQLLEIPQGTVTSHLSRAKSKLRELLANRVKETK